MLSLFEETTLRLCSILLLDYVLCGVANCTSDIILMCLYLFFLLCVFTIMFVDVAIAAVVIIILVFGATPAS